MVGRKGPRSFGPQVCEHCAGLAPVCASAHAAVRRPA